MQRFTQQAGLATARLAFEQHQPRLAVAGQLDLLVQLRQLMGASHKGRLGEGLPRVAAANHHGGIDIPFQQPLGNRLQVGEHRFGRLVAIARIFLQQALHDFIERARHEHPQRAQLGHGGRHVVEQDRTERIAGKRRTPSQTVKHHHAGGIEV